jgi:hypothetical protein
VQILSNAPPVIPRVAQEDVAKVGVGLRSLLNLAANRSQRLH